MAYSFLEDQIHDHLMIATKHLHGRISMSEEGGGCGGWIIWLAIIGVINLLLWVFDTGWIIY